MFHLQLPYFDFDEFIEYIDELPNAQPETTPEPPEIEIPGGNKRKRSAKRKSSKKRTTRSKKRSLK